MINDIRGDNIIKVENSDCTITVDRSAQEAHIICYNEVCVFRRWPCGMYYFFQNSFLMEFLCVSMRYWECYTQIEIKNGLNRGNQLG